ncbi:MAG TPA: MFS transporter [Acidimicrobiia bacterium]|nr:MFS transporter [Acidimicrobiia bacterium]
MGTKGRISSWPMWVLGLVIMVDQIDQNIVRGMVPQLKHAFGIDDAAIGLLLSAFVLVNGLVTVPAGYLADRWHRTRTIGHTVLGWSGITMLTAAATNFATLLGLRALLGFGQAVTEPSAASLLSDYYPTSQRGRVFSNQQVMGFIGVGLGIAIGGFAGKHFGWRWGFLVVGPPSVLVAALAYALREPARGHGDRLHVGIEGTDDATTTAHPPLFDDGIKQFTIDMLRGLRDDFRTIWAIPTLRYALVGVSALIFTVSGIGAWLAQFHERFSNMSQDQSTEVVGALIIFGGVPGVLFGGRLADRFATRVRGARVVIPAVCLGVGNTILIVSYLPIPPWLSITLQLIGIFAVTAAIPALRAGMADAVPAHLRGAGFGAFNLVSILFGAAAAPLIVGALAQVWNLRVAFLIVSPPVYIGALILFAARDHLEADAMKIFEAVMRAMAQDQQAG